jgi:hypothetical protein
MLRSASSLLRNDILTVWAVNPDVEAEGDLAMTILRDNLQWLAVEPMSNGTVVEHVRPTLAGYAWYAALVTGNWRVINLRSGLAKSQRDAVDLAEAAGMWLGLSSFAFELGPDSKSRGGQV